jgi:hypothetical protein
MPDLGVQVALGLTVGPPPLPPRRRQGEMSPRVAVCLNVFPKVQAPRANTRDGALLIGEAGLKAYGPCPAVQMARHLRPSWAPRISCFACGLAPCPARSPGPGAASWAASSAAAGAPPRLLLLSRQGSGAD